MNDVAQTNLQLYNQLAALGWDDVDLVLVRDAYLLATELFSGRLRPSGKTFLSHLVGTASVVAAVGERPSMVAAGLLHAAYASGEFGDGSRGLGRRKQRGVIEAVGVEVEQLVAAYTQFNWTAAAVRGLAARATSFDVEERELVVLRLANEVDDWADAGLRYWASDPVRPDFLEALTTLAGRVGLPQMAEELRHVGSFDATAEVPHVLVYRPASPDSRLPRSHRPRLQVAARELLNRPKALRWRATLRTWVERLPFARRVHQLLVRPDRKALRPG
jgi:(p)ppGpp synthase/HD superfamily hydrolase